MTSTVMHRADRHRQTSTTALVDAQPVSWLGDQPVSGCDWSLPHQIYLSDLSKQVGVHAVSLLWAHSPKVVLHANLGHQFIQSALERQHKRTQWTQTLISGVKPVSCKWPLVNTYPHHYLHPIQAPTQQNITLTGIGFSWLGCGAQGHRKGWGGGWV